MYRLVTSNGRMVSLVRLSPYRANCRVRFTLDPQLAKRWSRAYDARYARNVAVFLGYAVEVVYDVD